MLRGTLLPLIGLLMLCVPSLSGATDSAGSPIVEIPGAIHFTAPDGNDVVVTPGAYRVERGTEPNLKLTREGDQHAIEIQASTTTYGGLLDAPTALLIAEEGQDAELHLVLLLPDGEDRDAVGTVSGTRSRGTFSSMLTPLQVQSAVSQVRVASQPAPQRSAPASSASVVHVPAGGGTVKPPSSIKLGPGKWINWTYLQVNSPGFVAQTLADVQSGKRPRSFVAGLATPLELTEMLKRDWAAEVARLNAARQAVVTTRGPSPAAKAPRSGAAATPPTQQLPSRAQLPVFLAPIFLPSLPAQDLGARYSDEFGMKTFDVTAPADGRLEAELDIADAREKRFYINKVTAYTGEFVDGKAQVYSYAYGGNFDDIQAKSASDPTIVSLAGYVVLDVKAGQRVAIQVVFHPHPSIGPPVGQYEVPLQLSWHASGTGRIGVQTVPLRAYCNGIHFGLLAYAEQADAITLTDRSVDYPIVVTNSGATPVSGAFSAPQLPPGVTMNPVSLAIGPNSSQRAILRFNVNGQFAQDGPNQDMVVAFNSGGESRPINLSISIYHPWIWWCDTTDRGACGQTTGAPGLEAYNQDIVYFAGVAAIRQVQVWIKNDGQWWWKIDTFNTKSIDVGGSDFKATLSFAVNSLVTDTINVHIGPSTDHQYYEHQLLHPWISGNFLTAAQTGVTLETRD